MAETALKLPDLMTKKEALKYLRMGEDKFMRVVKKHGIKLRKPGRELLIKQDDVYKIYLMSER